MDLAQGECEDDECEVDERSSHLILRPPGDSAGHRPHDARLAAVVEIESGEFHGRRRALRVELNRFLVGASRDSGIDLLVNASHGDMAVRLLRCQADRQLRQWKGLGAAVLLDEQVDECAGAEDVLGVESQGGAQRALGTRLVLRLIEQAAEQELSIRVLGHGGDGGARLGEGLGGARGAGMGSSKPEADGARLVRVVGQEPGE